MKRLRQGLFKLDNKGAALVTVIVVTLFISIVATTMLFVSGRNYIMKQTDYQNKQSFYRAEETLDKLKEQLVSEVGVAYEYAYREMMRNYLLKQTDEGRLRYYADNFTSYLYYTWNSSNPGIPLGSGAHIDPNIAPLTSEEALEVVRNFMRNAKKEDEEGNMVRVFTDEMVNLVTGVDSFQIMSIENKNRFVLRGVQVYYVDDKGFSAYINTDIALTPPDYTVETSAPSPEDPVPSPPDTNTVNMRENVIYINWKKN